MLLLLEQFHISGEGCSSPAHALHRTFWGTSQWPCHNILLCGQCAPTCKAPHFLAASLIPAMALGQSIAARFFSLLNFGLDLQVSLWRCFLHRSSPAARRTGHTVSPPCYQLSVAFISQVTEVLAVHLSQPSLPLRSKAVIHLTYYSCYFKIRKVPYRAYFFPLPAKPQMIHSYVYIYITDIYVCSDKSHRRWVKIKPESREKGWENTDTKL